MPQSSSSQNYPIAWHRFESVRREPSYIAGCGFTGDFGQLSRWAARFRLAKSFQGLDLGNAYTHPDTPQLYSAIVRIFLVYSAFETYCRIVGLNPSNETQVKPLQDAQSQSEIISIIRTHDPQNSLFNFLHQHLTGSHLKQMMSNFILGEEANVSFLGRCVRHVFAHGVLTANSSGLSVENFDAISKIISNFLLDCMDKDFDSKIY
jgi:hypothetical protein